MEGKEGKLGGSVIGRYDTPPPEHGRSTPPNDPPLDVFISPSLQGEGVECSPKAKRNRHRNMEKSEMPPRPKLSVAARARRAADQPSKSISLTRSFSNSELTKHVPAQTHQRGDQQGVSSMTFSPSKMKKILNQIDQSSTASAWEMVGYSPSVSPKSSTGGQAFDHDLQQDHKQYLQRRQQRPRQHQQQQQQQDHGYYAQYGSFPPILPNFFSFDDSTTASSEERDPSQEPGLLQLAGEWWARKREESNRARLEKEVEEQRRKLQEEMERKRRLKNQRNVLSESNLWDGAGGRSEEDTSHNLLWDDADDLRNHPPSPERRMRRSVSGGKKVMTPSRRSASAVDLIEQQRTPPADNTAAAFFPSKSPNLSDESPPSSDIEDQNPSRSRVSTPQTTPSGNGLSVSINIENFSSTEESPIPSYDEYEGEANSDSDEESVIQSVSLAPESPSKDSLPPALLTPNQMVTLARRVLPPSVRYSRWKRAYSLLRDGDSFDAFSHKVKGETQTILIIRTTRGELCGGYADSPWENRGGSTGALGGKKYYGSGRACLFSFTGGGDADENGNAQQGKQESIKIYRWTGANRYIQLFDVQSKLLAFGGGGNEGEFGLCVEDDFRIGSTGPCDTFGNQPLCQQDRFNILDLEVWGFTVDFG